MRKNILAALTVLFLTTSSFAAVDLSMVDWVDLTGWNFIENGGTNTFDDVWPGVDLTVTAIGVFPAGNAALMGGEFLSSGHLEPNQSHSFKFDFTSAEQLVVEILTNDNEELVTVSMPGVEEWQLVPGSTAPAVNPFGSGLQFQGVATGFGTPGVSRYVVHSTDDVGTVTVTHASLNQPNKFEFIRIGAVKAVPEPGMMSLIGMSVLGLLGLIRRK